jgi:hypothetical protein
MFLIFFLFFFLFPNKTFAANEFNISQNLNYTINKTGDAFVNQKIELTNNFSEIYPKEYQLQLIGTNIQDIKAADDSGNILQKTDHQNDIFTVYLKFNQANLGKNKITKFNLYYNIPQFAIHKGNIWEISLPQYQNSTDNNKINANLIVPSSFGNLSFSSINSPNIINSNNQTQIQIDNIKDKKILFTFGNYQTFDFNLKYFLNNQNNDISKTEIAIPPQTESQIVIFKQINPLPQNIRIDNDGNWLAQYELQPKEKIEINVSGQSKIFSPLKDPVEVDSTSLIQEQTFWPVQNPQILNISQNLQNPKQIYDYVVNSLNYNSNNIDSAKRVGALKALSSPNNALCTEFTDLFITLARNKNIPAREIEGFAYTNNQKIKPTNSNADILHAWPQYYDLIKKNWISIDPTWGKTTNGIDYFNDLDLNHFALVIHGQNSQNPPPPGSYKDNSQIKTVNIDFATQEEQETFYPPKIISTKNSFFQNSRIIVQNQNHNALTKINISLPSQKWGKNIAILPPFSSIEFDIPTKNFFQSLLPKSQKNNFVIQYQNIGTPIFISTIYLPHFLNLAIFIGIIILILSLSGIILTSQKKSNKK